MFTSCLINKIQSK